MLKGLPPVSSIVAGTAGIAASRAIPGFVARFAPQVPTAGIAGAAVRGLAGLLAGQAVSRFAGRKIGEDFTLGVMLGVADDVAQTFLPRLGLGMTPATGAYLDAYLGGNAVGQYMGTGQTIPAVSGYDPGDRLNAGNRF